MHIYVFGSLCRGEVDRFSDVDLLALVETFDERFDTGKFSVYSYARIIELWREGNPFAWHLSLESRLLYSDRGNDFLQGLGFPAPYTRCASDCDKFYELYQVTRDALRSGTECLVFDLGTLFLSIRNFATCYSICYSPTPTFSRRSALELHRSSLRISSDAFAVLERARVLSTRGIGASISQDETELVKSELSQIGDWMSGLLREVKSNE